MIVGLCGLKNSGKDTVAAYLIKEYGFERRSFAEPLKRSLSALLDIPYHEIENFKNDDTVFVSTGYKNTPTGIDAAQTRANNMWSPIRELTFREALQRYGTEAHRDIFGRDFWVDQCLPEDGFYSARKIVVTDCRFENEATRVLELGGSLIFVERLGLISKDSHSSERPNLLPWTHKIENNSTVEQLHKNIELVFERILNEVPRNTRP